jgi:predicted metal-dependent peptidase
MGEAELHAALSEVEGIIKSAGAEVRVYACDAAVHGGTQRVRRAADVRLSGGGGTDMGAGLAFAAKQLPCAAATVVITDGWSPWPVQRPAQRVIVALVGAACAAPQTAPEWARVVEAADGA